ncbi:MAG: hypothetical protein WC974_02755 [Thermoplasmata archaeon]
MKREKVKTPRKIRKVTIGTLIGIIAMTMALIGYFVPWYLIGVSLEANTSIPVDQNGNTVNMTMTTNGFRDFMEISMLKGVSIKNPMSNISTHIDTSQLQQYGVSESDIQDAIKNATQNTSNNSGFPDQLNIMDAIPMPGGLTLDKIIIILILVGFTWGVFKILITELPKRRKKFMYSSIKVLIPIIIVVVIMTQILPMLPIGSGTPIANILNNMAASPLSGQGSANNVMGQPLNLGLRWGLGLGGYLFIAASILYIVSMLVITTELKTEAVEKAEKDYTKMVEDSKIILQPLKPTAAIQKPPTIVKLPPPKPTKASDFLSVETSVEQKKIEGIPAAKSTQPEQQIPAAAIPSATKTIPPTATATTPMALKPLTPPAAVPSAARPAAQATPKPPIPPKPAQTIPLPARSLTPPIGKARPATQSPPVAQEKSRTTSLPPSVPPRIPPKKKEEEQ